MNTRGKVVIAVATILIVAVAASVSENLYSPPVPTPKMAQKAAADEHDGARHWSGEFLLLKDKEIFSPSLSFLYCI